MTSTTPEIKKTTASLGPEGLEQALDAAFKQGASGLMQQIRYVLAYSQVMNAPEPENIQAYAEPVLTPSQARLIALLQLLDVMDTAQIQTLHKSIAQITDANLRLPLLAQVIVHLPAHSRSAALRDALKQLDTVFNQAVRAEVLLRLAPLIAEDDFQTAPPAMMPNIVPFIQQLNSPEARIRSLIALAQHVKPFVAHQLYEIILDEVALSHSDTLRANTFATTAPYIPTVLSARVISQAATIATPVERARALTALAQSHPDEERVRDQALDAIEAIRSEEERVEALIAFVPCLEYATDEQGYPQVLQRALTIAVGLSRKPLLARALVTLAPYLTTDLQGEALAAVHGLSSERERAVLLSDLAPHLPSDMLVASLAVAHTMREQDSRAHALGTLAHYVPANAQSQALLDALAAASNLSHHFERVRALVNLADILPPTLQEQAFTNAVETTRLIENENARARALSLLGQHLPPTLLTRALDAAYQIRDPQQQLNVMINLLPVLPASKQVEVFKHLLDGIQSMPLEYKQARALVSIAPHLPADLMPEALTIAEGLQEAYDRVNASIALLQNLAPAQRPAIIATVWGLVRKIDDGYDRASALVALAPFLPPTAQPDMTRMANSIVRMIADEYDQASAIAILAPILATERKATAPLTPATTTYKVLKQGIEAAFTVPHQAKRAALLGQSVGHWLQLDPQQAFALWQAAAHMLKTLPLADVLLCLGVLIPVLKQLGDQQSVDKMAQILGLGAAK